MRPLFCQYDLDYININDPTVMADYGPAGTVLECLDNIGHYSCADSAMRRTETGSFSLLTRFESWRISIRIRGALGKLTTEAPFVWMNFAKACHRSLLRLAAPRALASTNATLRQYVESVFFFSAGLSAIRGDLIATSAANGDDKFLSQL